MWTEIGLSCTNSVWTQFELVRGNSVRTQLGLSGGDSPGTQRRLARGNFVRTQWVIN